MNYWSKKFNFKKNILENFAKKLNMDILTYFLKNLIVFGPISMHVMCDIFNASAT